MNGKRAKKNAKKKKDGASMSSASSRGLGMVKGILNEKGVSTPPSPAAATSAPAPSTGDSGLDDIL